MLMRSNKRRLCKLPPIEEDKMVQNSLAVTPAQMWELQKQGIPISAQYKPRSILFSVRSLVRKITLKLLTMPNMNEFLQQFGNAALNGVTGGVSGLIGGAGNVVSTLLTNAANAKQNQAIMDFNARESQLQRQFSLDQWKRETTYNSPAEQVKRLRDAGLNPALAMGGSIDNSAAPSPSLSEAQVGGLTPMRAPEIDPLTAAQIENIKADTAKKNAEASETSTLLPFKVQNMVSNNRLFI